MRLFRWKAVFNHNRLGKGFRSIRRYVVIASLLSLITACQPSPEERYTRAEDYYAQSDYRGAILELKNALQATPDSGAARLLLADASYQVGDFATAEIEYERALGLGEDRPEVWVSFGRTLITRRKAREAFERVFPYLGTDNEAALVLQGDILSSLGNSAEANKAYLAALERNPVSPGALIGQAVVAASLKDFQGAIRLLNDAIRANPESPLVWRAKGNYLLTRRDFAGAVDAMATSMALETKKTPLAERFATRLTRATALIDAKRFDDATAQLEELVAEFPSHPSLRFIRGRIAFGTGDYDLAQAELQEYLARIPNDARGQAVLGAVNFSQDNLRQAEMYLMQAVRANVGGESIRRLLAETQLRLDKPDEALAALQAIQALGQPDSMLLSMLGRAEIGLGDTAAAIPYFEQGLEADPKNPFIALSLAASYMQANRTVEAIDVLESMEAVPGNLYQRETLLIGAYLRVSRRDDAIQVGDELLTNYSQDAAAYAVVAILHNSIGDQDRAEDLFSRALALDPDNLGALYHLGAMALSADNTYLAVVRFEKLLDAHPAYVLGLASLAAVLQRQGDFTKIRLRLIEAIDVAPNSIAPRVLMARVELADGRPDAALDVIRDARTLFPDEGGLDHLEGVVLLSKGHVRKALSSFEQAVSALPNNATYARNLASTMLKVGDMEMANDSPRAALSLYEAAAEKDWTRAVAIRIGQARQLAGDGNSTAPVERWLAEHPDDAGVRMVYAQLLEAAGDTSRAVVEYERLHTDGELNAVGLNNLAWQYFLMGRGDAVVLAQAAHDLDPQNGSITDTLGWILFNEGDTESAVNLLRKAVSQSPNNAAIQDHLNTALANR